MVEAVEVSPAPVAVVHEVEEVEEGSVVPASVGARGVVLVSSEEPRAAGSVDEDCVSEHVGIVQRLSVVSGETVSEQHQEGDHVENLDECGESVSETVGMFVEGQLELVVLQSLRELGSEFHEVLGVH